MHAKNFTKDVFFTKMRLKQKITIQDIAKKAGVSACTVSRVFNKHPYVKDEVSSNVLSVARQLDYTPKFATVEKKIAILINGLHSFKRPGYENIIFYSIMKRTAELGYGVEIVPLHENKYHFERFVKGAVSLVYSPETTAMVREKTGTPIVTVNNFIPGLSHVCSDHRGGSRKAVEYLVSKGHRRIGLMLNNLVNWGDMERAKGFKSELSRNGITVEENLISTSSPRGNTLEIMAKMMRHKPTAIFAAGENIGLEVTHALNLLNFRIPEDVSILSFENVGVSEYLTPALTTIDQGLYAIGEETVNTLVRIIEQGADGPESIVLPNQLIERDSVKNLE